jgi:chromosome segregation ATPase
MENNESLDKTQAVEDEQETQVVEEEVVEKTEENSDATQEVNEEESKDVKDDASQDDEESEDSEFTNALKKVRNEAKNLRKRLKDAEATIAELKANSNDELVKERDTYKQQLQDLKLEIRSDRTKAQVVEAARKANAVEPEAIADALMGKITYDENDKPTNVDKAISDYKATYKRLFTGAVGNGNIGNRNERGSKFEGMSSRDLLVEAFKQSNND